MNAAGPAGQARPQHVEHLIIALTAGAVLGLIMVAQGRTTDSQFTHPMHSPNDRARFATIRSLGDHGSYAIGVIDSQGKLQAGPTPLAESIETDADDQVTITITRPVRPGWEAAFERELEVLLRQATSFPGQFQTDVDRGEPGQCKLVLRFTSRERWEEFRRLHYLPWTGCIIAAPGWDTIDKVRNPEDEIAYSSKPPLLPTLLAFEYGLLKWLSQGWLNFTEHPHAVVRIIVATANWVPLLVFLFLYLRLLDRLASDAWVRAFSLTTAGAGTYITGFCVTLNNHTVAAFSGFFALYAALCIWMEGRRDTWLFGLAGLFGGLAAVSEFPAAGLTAAIFFALLWKSPAKAIAIYGFAAMIPLLGHVYANYQVTGSLMPAYAKKEWYEFPSSYWKIDQQTGRLVGTSTDPKTGEVSVNPRSIDSQYEPWYVYLFHIVLGHHGILSLSPVLFFSFVGLVRVIASRAALSARLVPLAVFTLSLTALLLLGYTFGPAFGIGQRNYGGMSNGMRWLFWVIPLWLVHLPMGLDWKSSSAWFRRVAIGLLAISIASSFHATRNPWTRPWIHEWLYQLGWIGY